MNILTKKSQVRHGMRVTCKIDGKEISDAKISMEGDSMYICQNVLSGSGCKDKLGYKYSWFVTSGGKILSSRLPRSSGSMLLR